MKKIIDIQINDFLRKIRQDLKKTKIDLPYSLSEDDIGSYFNRYIPIFKIKYSEFSMDRLSYSVNSIKGVFCDFVYANSTILNPYSDGYIYICLGIHFMGTRLLLLQSEYKHFLKGVSRIYKEIKILIGK